jgi:hypothetical protein
MAASRQFFGECGKAAGVKFIPAPSPDVGRQKPPLGLENHPDVAPAMNYSYDFQHAIFRHLLHTKVDDIAAVGIAPQPGRKMSCDSPAPGFLAKNLNCSLVR